MTKDSIIHFVGFITRLEPLAFVDQWRFYARDSASGNDAFVLEEVDERGGKYKYVSRHEFGEQNFRFSFMKSRDSENFPDQKARVVMFGGYMPTEIGNKAAGEKRILAFFTKDRVDLDEYRRMPHNGALCVYQPFYENCLFSYILEYFTPAEDADDLVSELTKKSEAAEIAVYNDCKTPYAVY